MITKDKNDIMSRHSANCSVTNVPAKMIKVISLGCRLFTRFVKFNKA